MHKKTRLLTTSRLFTVLFTLLLLLVPLAYAVGDWQGSVSIDSSAAVAGTRIDFYKGDSLVGTAYSGGMGGSGTGPSNDYRVGLSGSLIEGDNLTVKVWGITAATTLYYNGPNVLDLSVSTLANGAACSYDNTCTSGHCCSGLCAASCAPSGGGGTTTGVSGGGAVSTITTLNGAASQIWAAITADSTALMTITNTLIPITAVNIDVSSSKTNVKLSVIAGVPESIVTSVTGSAAPTTTYNYLELAPDGITNADIKSISVKFKVLKSWLIAKGYSKNDITLYRFYNSQWNELSTSVVSEDSTAVYYVATSPGFSYFAIGVKKGAQPIAPLPTVVEAPAPAETPTAPTLPEAVETPPAPAPAETPTAPIPPEAVETPAPEKPPVPAKKPEVPMWLWILLLVILIGVIAYFFLKPKKHKPQEQQQPHESKEEHKSEHKEQVHEHKRHETHKHGEGKAGE